MKHRTLWLRLYVSVKDDPQLQQMPAELFRFVINLWCAVKGSKIPGKLPQTADLAFSLRLDKKVLERYIKRLKDLDPPLLEQRPDGLYVRNWDGWQYESDVSTDRVKRFRERNGNVSCNVSETPDETPPEYRDRDRDRDRTTYTTTSACAREDDGDPVEAVRNVIGMLCGVWPANHRGDPRYAQMAAERAAAAHAAGVSAWCQLIARDGPIHAEAHKACRESNPRHFIPTIERWISSGDYACKPPEPEKPKQPKQQPRKLTNLEIAIQQRKEREAKNANTAH